MFKSFFVVGLLTLISSVTFAEVATYRVRFDSNWNKESHLGTPDNAHFSPIIVTSHNQGYDLLPLGGFANAALERVAELGDPSLLNPEIEEAQQAGSVFATLNTENMFINKQTSQSFLITVDAEHPYLSLVSMIAPSPDWIVGLSNFRLFSESQGFYQGVNRLPLYAFDGGTESGDRGGNFSINNKATNPQQPINILRGKGFGAPFAFVSIKLVRVKKP